jgi:hypothetical protein
MPGEGTAAMATRRHLLLAALLCGALIGCSAGSQNPTSGPTDPAPTATVSPSELATALGAAEPGDVIEVSGGTVQGGLYLADIHGTEDQPITVRAADPGDPPIFDGGGQAMHLVDVSWLVLEGLHVRNMTANGINIDDGGSFDTPSHDVVLRSLVIEDVGPDGNRDGLKLSGVVDFRVEGCRFVRWGSGGSGIDMVGCHRGVIEGCEFEHESGSMGSGVQAKGGSADITVRGCDFVDAGSRAVNIGGSTGLEFFRPEPQGYEAKDIAVEGCTFTGSLAPIAYVGVDGATVRYNTIYRPGRWAIRILQETTGEDFVPCRNGAFTDNIVVFRSGEWASGGVNIGPGTAPETFEFVRNLWYCEDQPAASTPSLPTEETDGVYGVDPQLADPEAGDFSLQRGSPAEGKGATALP